LNLWGEKGGATKEIMESTQGKMLNAGKGRGPKAERGGTSFPGEVGGGSVDSHTNREEFPSTDKKERRD